MQIRDILSEIENFAPIAYQESYDNCGIQVGNAAAEAKGALLTLDVTEATVQEAIDNNCNLVIAHHPLIFSGLKSITGKNYVERVVLMAIKHDIVIYAAHTNLDNVQLGVNKKIAEKLHLHHCKILVPIKSKLYKLFTFVPNENVQQLKSALFAAGLGNIGEYSECSFSTLGEGTFKPSVNSNPMIGAAGGLREQVAETKLEIIVPEHLKHTALRILRENHPYEEVAYELIALENENQTIGAGLIGDLEKPMDKQEFLSFLKQKMKTECVRYTNFTKDKVSKIAVCGGSGSFLLRNAIRQNADVFITADYKYHQFFDAENKIVIADIGHYESEQFTIEIFSEIIKEKFPNFALLFTKTNTNPVNYYY